ncbi:MAG: EAL domain-containing protein [Acidimicrobiales bacterium]
MISAIKMRHDEQGMYFALEHEATAAELSVSNEQLAVEASRDSLTGLSNRTDFTMRLEHAMATAEASTSQVGLLFIDLDHFKVVNDSLGHAAGDELLVEVANRILARLRPSDVLARLGGDEFTVLIPEVDGVDDVARIAERVLTAFDEPFDLQGRRHRMSASIGVACTGEQGLTSADLLRLADAALYQAKGEGRARTSVFDSSLRARLDDRLDDEAELRDAVANGEFTGWFQPIVDLTSGRVDAAEGLVRWVGPNGIRDAGSFIELAAELGLDIDLSAIVLDELHRLQVELRSIGAEIDLGFNLPPAHLLELLARFDGDADLSGITVEITETGVIADVERVVEHLLDIRRRGASVWLDDFGQGQSSMSLLTHLPLDAVKIDREFVTNVVTDITSQAIVSAIADIGHTLGYRVIAEGIETLAQADALRGLGVTHGQGFLFAAGLPGADFLALADQDFDFSETLGLVQRPGWRWLTRAQQPPFP